MDERSVLAHQPECLLGSRFEQQMWRNVLTSLFVFFFFSTQVERQGGKGAIESASGCQTAASQKRRDHVVLAIFGRNWCAQAANPNRHRWSDDPTHREDPNIEQ